MATSKSSTTSKDSATSTTSTTPGGVKNEPTVKGAVPYEEANKDNLAIPPNTETPVASTAEAAAATIAARTQHLTGESGLTTFDEAVGYKEGDIQTALSERARIVDEMRVQADDEAAERDDAHKALQRDRDTIAERSIDTEATRVPVTSDVLARAARGATVAPAGAAPAVGPGRVVADSRVPGTGVADPRDLAPGQDLSPSPPGGVSITPLPNKAGTPFSAL